MSAFAQLPGQKTKIYPEYWFYNETEDLSVIYQRELDSGMYLLTFYTSERLLYKMLANKRTVLDMDSSQQWVCIGVL